MRLWEKNLRRSSDTLKNTLEHATEKIERTLGTSQQSLSSAMNSASRDMGQALIMPDNNLLILYLEQHNAWMPH